MTKRFNAQKKRSPLTLLVNNQLITTSSHHKYWCNIWIKVVSSSNEACYWYSWIDDYMHQNHAFNSVCQKGKFLKDKYITECPWSTEVKDFVWVERIFDND